MNKSLQNHHIRDAFNSVEEYAIITLDKMGCIQSWNQGAERIKGYTESEIIGKSFRVFYPEKDVKAGKPEMLLKIATLENRAIDEGWRKRRDGTMFWGSVLIIAVWGEYNELEGFVKITKDLTEQRRQSQRLKNILDHAPDAMLLVDNEGKIKMVNRQVEIVFGYQRAELIDQKISMLLPESYRKNHFLFCNEFSLDTYFRPMKNAMNLLGIHKGGKEIFVEIAISPLDILNENSMFITTIRDVSEKKILIDNLIKAKQEAEESDRLKTAFLSTMNHELRTPINHILGLSELISISSESDEIIEFADTIMKSGSDLLEMINDIFALSEIESNVIKVREDTLSMDEILKELNHTATELLISSGKEDFIDLFVSTGENISLEKCIKTDKHKIIQVVKNIVSNALKFTDNGSVIILLSQPDEGTISISVKDTGIGIPVEKQGFIFDIFRQGDDTIKRRHGGIGAGLTIAHKIADLLGGEITFKSEPGIGTFFTFTFPVNIGSPEFLDSKFDGVII